VTHVGPAAIGRAVRWSTARAARTTARYAARVASSEGCGAAVLPRLGHTASPTTRACHARPWARSWPATGCRCWPTWARRPACLSVRLRRSATRSNYLASWSTSTSRKLGRIPDGGGWRAFGRGSAQNRRASVMRDRAARAGAPPSQGYIYLHHAVDGHSRLAYSEILPNERRETAAAFWGRA
jgi:hypothetical protein